VHPGVPECLRLLASPVYVYVVYIGNDPGINFTGCGILPNLVVHCLLDFPCDTKVRRLLLSRIKGRVSYVHRGTQFPVLDMVSGLPEGTRLVIELLCGHWLQPSLVSRNLLSRLLPTKFSFLFQKHRSIQLKSQFNLVLIWPFIFFSFQSLRSRHLSSHSGNRVIELPLI